MFDVVFIKILVNKFSYVNVKKKMTNKKFFIQNFSIDEISAKIL